MKAGFMSPKSAKISAADRAITVERHPSVEPAAAHPPDFCDYGVGIIAQRLNKLLAHTEGAKSGGDTNAIHQMRVWSRRSRAALDVFGTCFAGKTSSEYADFEREVKNVTRALGAARDLDVMLQTLRDLADSLPAEQRSGVQSLEAHLQSQRANLQRAVSKAVQRLENHNLKQTLDHMAARQGYKAVTLDTTTATPAANLGDTQGVKDAKGVKGANGVQKGPQTDG
jgi:CHAD domain-containing protein